MMFQREWQILKLNVLKTPGEGNICKNGNILIENKNVRRDRNKNNGQLDTFNHEHCAASMFVRSVAERVCDGRDM